MGLLLLRAINILLGKESVKWYTLYLPNNVTNLSIFHKKEAGALN